MYKFLISAYIFFLVGITQGTVGTMSKSCSEPFPWWLPFLMLTILVIPAVMGYIIGREDGETK